MKYLIKFKGSDSREYGEGKMWLSYYEPGGVIPILSEYDLGGLRRGSNLGLSGKRIGGGVSVDRSSEVQMITSLIVRILGEGDMRTEVLLRRDLKGRKMGNWEHVSFLDGRGRLVIICPLLKPIGARFWDKAVKELSIDLDRMDEAEKGWKDRIVRIGRKCEDLMVVRGDRVSLEASH